LARLSRLTLPALLLAAMPAAAQDGDLHFTENANGGWCYARVWGGVAPGSAQRMVLEFGYGAAEGKLGVTIHVAEWQRVRDADPNANIPMTLVLDTGTSARSAEGGYDSPYDDEAWGGWEPAPAQAILMLLKTAKSARVTFDGMDLGPFGLPPGGRMASSLTACAARLKAGTP
jgi:hypothetical protein